MKVKDCIFTRRSVRKYKKKKISDDKINSILEYALHAPSACNTQPWQFINVKDLKTKVKLSNIHKYCSFIKNAGCIIAVCYNPNLCSYKPSDMLSTAVAAQNILLGIHNEGLGACWIYVKDDNDTDIEKKVKNILNIPDNIEVLCLISVGYTDEIPSKKEIKSINDVIHKETW